jgi:hypothetical protein
LPRKQTCKPLTEIKDDKKRKEKQASLTEKGNITSYKNSVVI